MDILVLIASISILNYLWFNLGVKMTQKVSKGEEIETLKIPNPIKMYNEHLEKKEVEKEKEKVETILRNIERYDGTGSHQEDVPMM